jgi:hypothetical protein
MELIRTKVYEKRINKLLTPKEREEAENEIAGDPTVWPVIKGSGGVRKARFGRDDTGKSGGGRIGYVFWEAFATLYLLAAYGKNEKENFSKAELNAMKNLVETLLRTIRNEKAKPAQSR